MNTADIQTIPIPGSSNPTRVRENTQSAAIKLSDADLKGISDILAGSQVKGGRYAEQLNRLSMQ
jgi:pyridoxine 4-dehydrogenase